MIQKNVHVDLIDQLIKLDSNLEIILYKVPAPEYAQRIERFRDYIQRIRTNLLLAYIQNSEIQIELSVNDAQQALEVLKKATHNLELQHTKREIQSINKSLSEVQQVTQTLLSSLPGTPVTPPPDEDD